MKIRKILLGATLACSSFFLISCGAKEYRTTPVDVKVTSKEFHEAYTTTGVRLMGKVMQPYSEQHPAIYSVTVETDTGLTKTFDDEALYEITKEGDTITANKITGYDENNGIVSETLEVPH